jgi:hypothetical protein
LVSIPYSSVLFVGVSFLRVATLCTLGGEYAATSNGAEAAASRGAKAPTFTTTSIGVEAPTSAATSIGAEAPASNHLVVFFLGFLFLHKNKVIRVVSNNKNESSEINNDLFLELLRGH